MLLKLLSHDLRWRIIVALASSDLRVQELAGRLQQPKNLVSYHLKRLRALKLVTEHRSSADARAIYCSLDLDRVRAMYLESGQALHPALLKAQVDSQVVEQRWVPKPARVLFLCTHNSARSQMAEGLLRHMGRGRVEAFSAGSRPTQVDPMAVQMMAEMGIDIHQQRAKHLDEFTSQSFDYVISVCDRVREACPVFPGDPERIHWSFPDPAIVPGEAKRYAAFQETATQLAIRISYLLIMMDRAREERSQGD